MNYIEFRKKLSAQHKKNISLSRRRKRVTKRDLQLEEKRRKAFAKELKKDLKNNKESDKDKRKRRRLSRNAIIGGSAIAGLGIASLANRRNKR